MSFLVNSFWKPAINRALNRDHIDCNLTSETCRKRLKKTRRTFDKQRFNSGASNKQSRPSNKSSGTAKGEGCLTSIRSAQKKIKKYFPFNCGTILALIPLLLQIGCLWIFNFQWNSEQVFVYTKEGEECRLENYLSPFEEVKGFHVLCISLDEDSTSFFYKIAKRAKIKAFVNGFSGKNSKSTLFRSLPNLSSFRRDVETYLPIQNIDELNANDQSVKWKMFTPKGQIIDTVAKLRTSGIIFVFEGGAFIWPGVAAGHRITLKGQKFVLETLSLRPLVFAVANLLTNGDCDHFIEIANEKMVQSEKHISWKNMSHCWIHEKESTVVTALVRRVSLLTQTPLENHEGPVEIVKFEKGQFYDDHHDFFDTGNYQYDNTTSSVLKNGYTNRLATVFIFLSSLTRESGGEVIFSRYNDGDKISPGNHPRSYCSKGLVIRPHKTRAILWYNMLPNGEVDALSLHGHCVVNGNQQTKWAANKFVWNNDRNWNWISEMETENGDEGLGAKR